MKQKIRLFIQCTSFAWALLLLFSSIAHAQVVNDDCTTAVALTTSSVCTVPVNGTVATATQSLAPTTACGFGLTSALDVWYSFTATSTNHLVTLAPRFAAILDVRSGSCTASTSVFCATIANNNTAAVPVGGLVSGQSYFIRIYPATNTPPTGISSTFALCIGQGATGPTNDDCAGAIAVPVNTTGACTNTVSADNTLATASASVAAPTCGNYLGRDLWFSVTVPASGSVTVQTVVSATGSDVGDTGMSMYSGTCGALTDIGCNDDGAGNLKSLLSFTGRTPGEVLFVRVWSFGDRISGNIAVCATTPTPLTNDDCAGAVALPVTTACTTPVAGTVSGATQSLPSTANCGIAATANDVWYSFTAGGTTQTLAFNGNFQAVVDVRSGTCASSTSVFCGTTFTNQPLTLTGLTIGQPYFLRLYPNNNIAPPVNAQFTLCLTPGPTPAANDECATAVALPVTTACTTPVAGTVNGASQSLPAAACGFTTNANDVWYSFTAGGATQTLTFTGGFQAVVEVRSGTCASSASVFCGTTFTNQPLILSGLTSGQSYFLRLYPNATGLPLPGNAAFTLCLTPGPTPPANDECTGAVALTVNTACIPVSGTVAGASQSLAPTTGCGFATNANDVWYSFTAGGTTQTLTFTGSFGAVVDVRSGTCASSAIVFCGTTFTNQPLTLTALVSGQTYFLRIFANANVQPLPANAAFTICLTPGAAAAANDDCSAAVAIAVVQNCANSTNGTVVGASQSLPPSGSCGTATTAADVWYSFVAGGITQQITLNPRFGAVLDVLSGTCTNSTSIFCTTVFAGNTTGTIVGGLTSGQTYFIRIYANGTVQPVPANATFTLCVSPAPAPPVNDECTAAVALTVGTTCTAPVSGTVEAASQSLPPAANCGFAAMANDVWYSFTASGVAQLITLNSRFGAVVDVRTGTCASSTSLTCLTVQPGSTTGTSIGGLTSGQTYYLRIYANGTAPTSANATFTLCVTTPPPPPINDDCAGAINIPVQFGTTCVSQTTADNTDATGSTGAPVPTCASYQGRDLWFSVTVPASGIVTVRTVVPTIGTDVGDTGMSIYSGACTTLTQLDCDDDGAGNLKSLLTITGRTPGEVLYVRVWGYNGTRLGTLAVCATSPTNCTTPTAPVAASVTATTAQLNWQPGGTPATGTTYTVEYGLQGFALGAGTVVTGLTTASTQLTSLQPGTAYCFYVRQDCPGGNGSSAYAGPICFTTPCAVPTSPTATAITNSSAQLGWQTAGTPPSGTTYTVEYGLQNFVLGTGTVISGITSPSFQLTGLQAGTAYCFYVRQDCPGSTGNGAYAGPACFTTTAASGNCASPTNPTATPTVSTVQLAWQPGGTPATGTTYTVQYGLQGFVLGTGITVSGIVSANVLLTGLAAATSYCFYVRQDCPGAAGSSAFVGPICFQTLATGGGPANDDPCGAVTLALTPTGSPLQPISSTNVGATTSAQPGIGAPTCSPATTQRDVWFAMTPATGVTSVTLTLTGAPAGMVRVFSAPNCTTGPFTLVSCRSSGVNNTSLGTITLTGLTPGARYYLAVSGYGAADTPGAFTISGAIPTAARVQADTNALLVYPNPSNTGQLTLKLGNATARPSTISLVNVLGQVVRTATLAGGTTEHVLNTHDLATGLYTVRVVSGSAVFTRKVTLE
ncbi:fibronectin type III domain-containing protein [Hymenobacter negativus]|uniref:T9SS type A sorting domain-containing protein n=1 Tax=Hymenobacter negativus TaxID=2795026 RepID=A0ABS3QNC4_9BACT|nr:T9SS type A sorting domain-containing protein [Hymenobacter negativus]MBO2012777.1 T9SS type A sorting domain-containing protein [Hymenobacter negativus]